MYVRFYKWPHLCIFFVSCFYGDIRFSLTYSDPLYVYLRKLSPFLDLQKVLGRKSFGIFKNPHGFMTKNIRNPEIRNLEIRQNPIFDQKTQEFFHESENKWLESCKTPINFTVILASYSATFATAKCVRTAIDTSYISIESNYVVVGHHKNDRSRQERYERNPARNLTSVA